MNTTATSAAQAAWRLAFEQGGRTPLAYEMNSDGELLPLARQAAPEASPECLHELARVRALCERVRAVAADFRAGLYPSGAAALSALRAGAPGFTGEELDRAFGAALVWTAL
jgi:hypothetical protein